MSLRDEFAQELATRLGIIDTASSGQKKIADVLLPWLEQQLTDREVATVERVLQVCQADRGDSTWGGLLKAIRALSPDPDWLRRKELEAQETKLNQLLDAWKKQVLPEKYLLGWLEIQRNEVIREQEKLDRQLKVLEGI